jgi:deazaflavin-dependent oxidoreductase (nitroreductase family)
MPMWVARVNRRVFNPWALKRGTWPVLTHVGRTSGRTYRTPLDATAVENGYVFTLVYGSDSDWVQNVLKAGTAMLEIEGDVVELVSPRLVSEEDAWKSMPEGTKAPPGFLRVTEYLRMDARG